MWPELNKGGDDAVTEKRKAELLGLSVDDYRGCSSDIIAKRAVSVTLWKYLSMHDNRYRVDISKADAGRIGVPPDLYDEVCEDIGDVNRILADHENDRANLHVNDVFNVYKGYADDIAATRKNYAGAAGLKPDSVLMREMMHSAGGYGGTFRVAVLCVLVLLIVIFMFRAKKVSRR